MATFKPTPNQQRAIDDRGQNILVSASAGSGKTAVLVQRAIKLIKEGVGVDRMMMVTFTDAAAKNMRDKIRDALQKAIREPAHNVEEQEQHDQMAKQINRLAVADISTIHAFCLKLIKRYYYLIHLDPQFRLLTDDTERLLLQEEVWQQVSEQLYGQAGQPADEEQASFAELVTNFSSDRDDQGLDDLVLRLYETANAQPEPEEWLRGLANNYFLGDSEITASPFYQKQLKPAVKSTLQQLVNDYEELSVRLADLGYDKPAEIVKSDQATNQELIQKLDQDNWNTLRAAFQGVKYARMSGGAKKKDPEYVTYQSLIKVRNGLKDQLKGLTTDYFSYDEVQFRRLSNQAAKLLNELSAVTIKFSQAYQQAKLNRHVLEFSDLEHYAYQILTPPDDQADWQTLVNELRNHYREIMIDEYQDTNPLQEKILMQLTSPERHNLFMVGDVKQSIYRFREADPTLFLTKYERYRQDDGGEAIVLAENFRSMRNVTDFTNLLFEQLMDHQVGEIDYDKDAHLKYAATYYDEAPENKAKPAELLLYDANADPHQENQEDDKLTGELRMVAMRIKQMVANRELIYDSDEKRMRPIEFGDIVLLERTKEINNTLMEQFNELEVPLTVHDVESYFQATEVRVMMSLLKIIDNPKQDIPLVAVLRSPIVGLNNKELAFIRLQNRQADFYTALVSCKDNFDHHHLLHQSTLTADQLTRLEQKLDRFMTQLTTFRQVAQQQTLVELIWRIYQETGYLDYVGAMPGGQQRQANLHALYERAHTYEQSSFKGLYQFTRFIEKMQEHDQDLGVAPTQLDTNAVNVMTIHGSKGLQFPVVFLIDSDHHFNNAATRENAVVDPNSGVGVKVMDEHRLVYDTPQRQIVLNDIQRGERAEDLRVLYVALTRAEQRLIITASFNESRKGQKLAEAWNGWQRAFQSHQQLIGAQLRTNAKSFMDWIGLALARYSAQFNGAQLSIRGTKPEDAGVILEDSPLDMGKGFSGMAAAPNFTAKTYTAAMVDQQLQAINGTLAGPVVDNGQEKSTATQINQILAYRYPHDVATQTTAYQSVTDVKRVFEDPDNREMAQWDYDQQRKVKNRGLYLKNDFTTPRFIQQDDQSPAATEVGTATHLVFQKLPLTNGPITAETVHDEVERLVKDHLIAPTVAQRINEAGVAAFFSTLVGQQILTNGKDYHREEPFAMIMNGHELFKEVQAQDDERILIHGIIDGYLQTSTGITLVDYKTDHINPQAREVELEKITGRYRGQLELYRQALNMMKPVPVVQMGLYLVELKEFIPFKIEGRP